MSASIPAIIAATNPLLNLMQQTAETVRRRPDSTEPPPLEADLESRRRSQPGFPGKHSNPLQTYRLQTLDAAFEQVELSASYSRFSNGVRTTGQLLYQRASLDLRFSSTTLDRYARQVAELEGADPDLLNDYLTLIKLLDKHTPDSLDSFFEELERILKGAAVPDGTAAGAAPPAPPGGGESATRARVGSFFFEVSLSVTHLSFQREQQIQQADPLVLDLDGDGIEVTDHASGRRFDINADGKEDRTAFVTGGDAFLALDRNGNGRIDSGAELFGDQHGAANGFVELARFDDNSDRTIDARDAVFSSLRLFDGVQLRSLASAGIVSIGTGMTAVNSVVQGNTILGNGSFSKADGSSGKVADLLLNYTT